MTSWQDIQQGANPFISATRELEVIAEAGLSQRKDEFGRQFWMHTMIPAIVMKAFSCEIMLKAILRHENIPFDRIHKLNELYGLLDTSAQSTPQAKAIQISIKTAVISSMRGFDDAKFNASLDEAGNLFVDWRYFFEESTSSGKPLTAPITFLNALFLALEAEKNALS